MLETLASQLKQICADYIGEATPMEYTRIGHVPKVVKAFITRDRSGTILVNDVEQRPVVLVVNPSDFPLGPPAPGDSFSVGLPNGVRALWTVTKPAFIKALGSTVLQYRVEVKG